MTIQRMNTRTNLIAIPFEIYLAILDKIFLHLRASGPKDTKHIESLLGHYSLNFSFGCRYSFLLEGTLSLVSIRTYGYA